MNIASNHTSQWDSVGIRGNSVGTRGNSVGMR
jgi:hypothetical protein